jgi:mannose-6-phosphate isomerase-like protein (cupin superfamily)
MLEKVNLDAAFASFDERWSPRIAAEINDFAVKLVKLEGAFVWHRHETEDELFLVVSGRVTIRLRDGEVALEPGELLVVPHGVEHMPVAQEPCELMLFERTATRNTGDVTDARTVERPKRLA